MDKKEGRFNWMATAMPGVVKLVADYRKKWGDEHVTDCVMRGLRGEPGYFFAREGAVMVGTPFDTDPVLIDLQWRTVTKTQSMVLLKRPAGVTDAAN